MATVTAPQARRWVPWARYDDLQDHLRDDAEVHRQASAKSEEILTGIDALNLSVTSLSTKLGPLLPITDDLGQIVGRSRFRHQVYEIARSVGRGTKKVIGWGGGTIVALATLAAVYAPANDLLAWLMAKITFGVVTGRVPAIAVTPSIPPIPGVTH